MKKTLIILVSALALAACAKEEKLSSPLVFRAQLDDETKVSFSAGKMNWVAGDVIRVSNGTDWADVTLSASDITPDGRTAVFSVSSVAAASTYYAVYPATSCGSGFTLDGGNVVVAPSSAPSENNVFTCVSSCSADDLSLKFHHPMALIIVTTTYSAVDHVTLRTIGGQTLMGSISVNPSTAESSWAVEGATSVTAQIVNKKAIIELPATGYYNNGLALDVYDSGNTLLGTVSKTGRRTVAKNTYYSFATGTLSGVPVATVGGTSYTSFPSAISAFNTSGGTLTYAADYSSEITFNNAVDGIVDMAGNNQGGKLWLQNNTGTITMRNGTCTQTGDCFDGKSGFSDGYTGKVILENMTVCGILWTDSHPFEIRSGNYNIVRNMYFNSIDRSLYPDNGTITITGGSFQNFEDYHVSGWSYGDYIISGGTFAFDPRTKTNVTIVSGYHVEQVSTTEYRVVAD